MHLRSLAFVSFAAISAFAAACSGASDPAIPSAPDAGAAIDAGGGGGDVDASTVDDGAVSPDAAALDGNAPGDASVALATCPTTGKGAIVTTGGCFTFTPAQAGAAATGDNATATAYALEPVGSAKGGLVVELNGSHGTPTGQIAAPDKNYYNAAAQTGFHVIGLAYHSSDIIGSLCNGQPDCYAPTRKSVILGKFQAGVDASLKNIQEDEGIVARLDAALRLMVASRPGQGWDAFLKNASAGKAEERIAWGKIVASGHSQGGGHAAMIGQMYAVRRVIQLSSTCDEVAGTPAPWTSSAGAWATSPATSFVGFAAPTTFTNGKATGGDTICPYHATVWQNLGMDAARMHDDAATCGNTGITHGSSIECTDNFDRWKTLFE